ncbi:MAG: hypothetical protein ABEH43_11380 [Flavobacteriales bacterium]
MQNRILKLKPDQRGGRAYKNDDVKHWLNSYSHKIEFFINEVQVRGLPVHYDQGAIIYYH